MGTAKPPKSRQITTEHSEPEPTSDQAPLLSDGAQDDAVGSSDTSEGSGKPPKKKFKYTRQLVRIAHDEGMTQTEIGKLCRVQQSVVSKWMKGESRGTEQQLAPLLKWFGARLNRTTSRVYLAVQDPDARWEDTEFGKHLLQLAEQEARAKPREDSFIQYNSGAGPSVQEAWKRLMPLEEWRHVVLKDVIRTYREFFVCLLPLRVVQVEGPILFRYSFSRLDSHLDRRGIEVNRMPVVRWALHDGQHGKFVLVRQYRRALLLIT